MKNDMVIVTCYGNTKQMRRPKALEYYAEAMSCSEGSERERYAIIVSKLLNGETNCTDEY